MMDAATESRVLGKLALKDSDIAESVLVARLDNREVLFFRNVQDPINLANAAYSLYTSALRLGMVSAPPRGIGTAPHTTVPADHELTFEELEPIHTAGGNFNHSKASVDSKSIELLTAAVCGSGTLHIAVENSSKDAYQAVLSGPRDTYGASRRMLVPTDEDVCRKAWSQIKQESLSHSTYRAVIFVACMDVDAFAAAQMLSALLKKHLILYKTEPVVGYESLKTGFKRLDSSIRNVFLVGCGADVDLEQLLELDQEDSAERRPKIHVFDRNRPWNLNNLFGSDLVYCYDDSDNDGEMKKYENAYMFLSTADENEEEEDLEDERDEDNEEDIVRKRAIESDSENEETQEDASQFNEVKVSSKKRRKTQRAVNIELLEQYYQQGNFLISTNATQVYALLTYIGETTPRMLWLAIVGLTALEMRHPQLYRMIFPMFIGDMNRLNMKNHAAMNSSSTNTSTKAKNNNRVGRAINFYAEADYSLFLLRQWSLYESIIHSSYMSAKLFLWREDGRKKLHKMLAMIGVTLQDAKESWIHTRPGLKRELKQKLEHVTSSYGIEGVIRQGVVRQFGLAGTLSAGDWVESVAAYLEAGEPENTMTITGVSVSGITVSSLAGVAVENGDGVDTDNNNRDEWDTTELPQDAHNQQREAWVSNFWIAWDAVDNFELLKRGSEQAKQLQMSVVSTANFVFEKNLARDLKSFRMVIVQDAPELEVFLNPLAMQRLALWVAEGCAEMRSTNIPFVLALLDETRNVYLVIGMGNHRSQDQTYEEEITSHNHFGQQFQATAEAVNATIRVDAFDSSIIEVQREDLPRFLEALDSEIQISK